MDIVLMFPGQGSQYKGMCKKLIESEIETKMVFEEASEILRFDLIELITESKMSTLTLSENAQPAVVAASYALYKDYMKKIGIRPTCAVGHSLGEISALTCAGSIPFQDAIKLSKARGKMMQTALEKKEWGAGLAVDLTQKQVEDIIEKSRDKGYIVISGYNSPKQFVIAGERRALLEFDNGTDKTSGQFIPFKMIPMKADTAYHSSLMAYCQPMMREMIKDIPFSKPKFEIFSTVTGERVMLEEEIRTLLVNQLVTPIKWNQTLEKVSKGQGNLFVDIGPNKLMYNLLKESKQEINSIAYEDGQEKMHQEILAYAGKQ